MSSAIMNSESVGAIISGYIVDNHLSTHPIENVVIPRYDPNNVDHTEPATLSRAASTTYYWRKCQGSDGVRTRD